jgi:hypothetical protein
VKVLVICAPRPGVQPGDIAAHAAAEMAALKELQADGTLTGAYSPGGPGAVLIFEAGRPAVETALAGLPMVLDGLIDTEIIELHPFPGLAG